MQYCGPPRPMHDDRSAKKYRPSSSVTPWLYSLLLHSPGDQCQSPPPAVAPAAPLPTSATAQTTAVTNRRLKTCVLCRDIAFDSSSGRGSRTTPYLGHAPTNDPSGLVRRSPLKTPCACADTNRDAAASLRLRHNIF